jgi:hypothetical protein
MALRTLLGLLLGLFDGAVGADVGATTSCISCVSMLIISPKEMLL